MTREQAAAYIGQATQTLAAWASLGRHGLPYFKIGRRVWYRKRDLDAWLDKQVQGAAAATEEQ